LTGNRCGHDPSHPRVFAPPEHHKSRPPILTWVRERLSEYFERPSLIPSLNAANGSPRQQRSERREACLLVMDAMIHYVDLVKLIVGVPQEDGGVRGIPMKRIAELTGMELRRVERAMRDLVSAGLVTVHRICEQIEPDRYIGYPAIRVIPSMLFSLFGLDRNLSQERKRASERRNEAGSGQEPNRADLARLGFAIKAGLSGHGQPVARPPETPPPENRPGNPSEKPNANAPRSATEMMKNLAARVTKKNNPSQAP